MRLGEVRDLSSDEAATLAKHLRETLSTPGWGVLLRVLDDQAGITEGVMLQPPRANEAADSYGLRMADQTGYVRGLRAVGKAAERVIRDADEVVRRHQLAAEQAARFEEAQRG